MLKNVKKQSMLFHALVYYFDVVYTLVLFLYNIPRHGGREVSGLPGSPLTIVHMKCACTECQVLERTRRVLDTISKAPDGIYRIVNPPDPLAAYKAHW